MSPDPTTPNAERIELGQLRSFLAVVEERRLDWAADRLKLSVPRLSSELRRLEHEVGVELVVRHSAGVTPTEAGHAFADEARKVVAGLDVAISEAHRAGGAAVPLRVGCAPYLTLQHVQSFLGALYDRDPALAVEVSHMPAIEQLRRVRSGELDLGVVQYPREELGLELAPLFRGERLAAFLPPGHRLAGMEALSPADLESEALLSLPRAANPALYDAVVAATDRAGYRFRAVRETGGADLRDLLFALALDGGVALGGRSWLRAAGGLGSLVTGRGLDPAVALPDVRVAWRAVPPAHLGHAISHVRAAAAELHGSA
jgi:DNA-binding transcriptional LysR family regulator